MFLKDNQAYITHVFNTFSSRCTDKLIYGKVFLVHCLKIYTLNNVYKKNPPQFLHRNLT